MSDERVVSFVYASGKPVVVSQGALAKAEAFLATVDGLEDDDFGDGSATTLELLSKLSPATLQATFKDFGPPANFRCETKCLPGPAVDTLFPIPATNDNTNHSLREVSGIFRVTRMYQSLFYLPGKQCYLNKDSLAVFRRRENEQLVQRMTTGYSGLTQLTSAAMKPSIYFWRYLDLYHENPAKFSELAKEKAQHQRVQLAQKDYKPEEVLECVKLGVEEIESNTLYVFIIFKAHVNIQFEEGMAYEFLCLDSNSDLVTNSRNELSAKSSSRSTVLPTKMRPLFSFPRRFYSFTEVHQWSSLSFHRMEISTVGRVEEISDRGVNGTVVGFSDGNGEFINVRFFAKLEDYGVEQLMRPGNILALENLLVILPISCSENVLYWTDRSEMFTQNVPTHLAVQFEMMHCLSMDWESCQFTPSPQHSSTPMGKKRKSLGEDEEQTKKKLRFSQDVMDTDTST